MTLHTAIFYFFVGLAALAGIAILLTRNVFYAALSLIVCLLAIAGVYVFAFAEFVAVSQLLVYAGGILVVMVFAIMLTARVAGKSLRVSSGRWYSGIFAGALIFSMLAYYLLRETFTPSAFGINTDHAIANIGVALMTDFILPFELSGILLLVALIGAAVAISSIKSTRTE